MIVVVTGGRDCDLLKLKQMYTPSPSDFLMLFLEGSRKSSRKVGNLYEAYKVLFEKLNQEGFDYLNLLQSDFQLIFWNEAIKSNYIEILQNFPNSMLVNTGFVRRGSHPNLYDSTRVTLFTMPNGDKIVVNHSTGIQDWGFFSLERVRRNGFVWQKSEGQLSDLWKDKNYVVPYSPLPSIAAIPWPQVIRNGKAHGKQHKRKDSILLAPKKPFEQMRQEVTLFKWQEDWISTVGFYSLEPTWATDLSSYYLKINKVYYGGLTKIPFRFTSLGQPDKFPITWPVKKWPSNLAILTAIFRHFYFSIRLKIKHCYLSLKFFYR